MVPISVAWGRFGGLPDLPVRCPRAHGPRDHRPQDRPSAHHCTVSCVYFFGFAFIKITSWKRILGDLSSDDLIEKTLLGLSRTFNICLLCPHLYALFSVSAFDIVARFFSDLKGLVSQMWGDFKPTHPPPSKCSCIYRVTRSTLMKTEKRGSVRGNINPLGWRLLTGSLGWGGGEQRFGEKMTPAWSIFTHRDAVGRRRWWRGSTSEWRISGQSVPNCQRSYSFSSSGITLLIEYH